MDVNVYSIFLDGIKKFCAPFLKLLGPSNVSHERTLGRSDKSDILHSQRRR